MKLSDPVNKVPRVSKAYQEKLERLDIKTVGDLVFHLPRRYQDLSNIKFVNKIELEEEVCVRVKVNKVSNRKTFGNMVQVTTATIEDGSGLTRALWFNQPWMVRNINEGDEVFLAGKVKIDNDGTFLSNPTYEKVKKGPQIHSARVISIYPETEGVSSRWLRYILYPLLKDMNIPETLPQEVLDREELMSLQEAIQQIHLPSSVKAAYKARQRLAFEELLLLQLFLLKKRREMDKNKAPSIAINKKLLSEFGKSLPFELTEAQRREAWQILQDMTKSSPMLRLLHGDVGSGKTVVAALALLNATQAGWQTALMAPTEVLAHQHFNNLSSLLNTPVHLLTGSKKTISPEEIRDGQEGVIVGTHALIQDKVQFKNLALIVIDEQHRFGVKQRSLLKNKGMVPHLLSMTATPIPRSLALTIYGDLDLSTLDELPKNRAQIKTEIVEPTEKDRVYSFIKKELKKGRQAFVICPRISASQKEGQAWADVRSVEETYEELLDVFPDFKIAPLHGQMETDEKEETMKRFKDKSIDLLVATSVIEVGVDIPNATIMVIEDGERFGLSQLHQMRGRIGRSDLESYCFVFTKTEDPETIERLEILEKSQDGFIIAEKDLELRGPGSLSGYTQTGLPPFKVATLKNANLIKRARDTAQWMLDSPLDPKVKKRLKRFNQKAHLE